MGSNSKPAIVFGQPILIVPWHLSEYSDCVRETGMRLSGALHLGQPKLSMGLQFKPAVVFGQPVRLHLTGSPVIHPGSPHLCVRQRPKNKTRPALRLAGFASSLKRSIQP